MTIAATKQMPQRPEVLSRRSGGLLAFLAVMLLVGLRAGAEWKMMREFGSDPQMAIWLAFIVVKLAAWLVAGSLAAGLTVMAWRRPWGFRAAVVLLFGWTLAIGWSNWEYQRARQALVDARNPATTPARLQQLAEFRGIQAGYELDNRIATNPNASPEVLRTLYHRGNLGTLMILARNPNTPVDVLQAMVDRHADDKWIRSGLKTNPNLPEAARQKLNAALGSGL